jgi:hypothetical protein
MMNDDINQRKTCQFISKSFQTCHLYQNKIMDNLYGASEHCSKTSYAFAAASTLETYMAFRSADRRLRRFSAKQFMDCAVSYGANSLGRCTGGDPQIVGIFEKFKNLYLKFSTQYYLLVRNEKIPTNILNFNRSNVRKKPRRERGYCKMKANSIGDGMAHWQEPRF